MTTQRSLFEEADSPEQASRLAPVLLRLAERKIFFGTSSWKYEGWLGSIYQPGRYETRRKFSRKKFESDCLHEYAEIFPTVGGDFSFYKFLSAEQWAEICQQTSPEFTFGLKCTEQLTVRRWPRHARYGRHAGLPNEGFLDPDLFQQAFLAPLEKHAEKVGVIMMEFGAFSRDDFANVDEFLEPLSRFLTRIPSGFRIALEIRNENYLVPDYFSLLAKHNIAHVFNAWTRMPNIVEQWQIAGSDTADFLVARALLRHGRKYEDAVAMFEPYVKLQEPEPTTRAGLIEIANHALNMKKPAFLFVNNRLEGHAPSTIEAVAAALNLPST